MMTNNLILPIMMTYNIYMDNKVCFIGHRKIYDHSVKNRLKMAIQEQLEQGAKIFTMGTCGDFDVMALSVCRELRNQYPQMQIQVIITSFAKIKKQVVFDDELGKEYETPYSDVQTIMYNIEEIYVDK